MLRRTLAAAALSAATLPLVSTRRAAAQAATEIQFWHGLPQPLGGLLEQVVAGFNASQQQYKVAPSFRGAYPETMVAAIAAFRANNAPHIVQMFEVGTGTMMAAGRAVKPVHELLAEAGVNIDFNDYLPPVRGYYQAADGKQMSMPFNSSTAIMWINHEHFTRAGLDPSKPPRTFAELEEAAKKLKAAGIASPISSSWPSWILVEQLSSMHNQALATQGNGFAGMNAELRINNPILLRHLNNLVRWHREGLFKYGGRGSAADALFPAGECSIVFASSGLRARVSREARFPWSAAMLPHYPDVAGAPYNSIIGGASFWAMNKGPQGGRSAAEWKAVAEFYRYVSDPQIDAKWHQDTGYVPVRRASYQVARNAGYYAQNPGADVAIEQLLLRGETTENTRGIRLGGFVEIRTIIEEELEKALQGQQTAEQALTAATTRGNAVLRNFERQNR